jgi:hypothetical protein
MKIFGLKKWLIVLVAFFGFASMGSAQNIGAGFHWGNGVGGNLVINLSKGLALRGNLDLSLGNFNQTATFGAAFGFDFSFNFRIPLVADGTELYLGPGIVLGVGRGGNFGFGLMALVGLELQLSKGVAFYTEFQPISLQFVPGVAFGFDSFTARMGLTFYF